MNEEIPKVPVDSTLQFFSLRDWFAGQALIGVQLASELCYAFDKKDYASDIKDLATDAYRIADAMLAERAKERREPPY